MRKFIRLLINMGIFLTSFMLVLNGQNHPSSVIPNEAQTYDPKILITVTLGSGAQVNPANGVPTPYGTYLKNFRQQYLVLASELLPLAIGPGDITALGFNVSSVNNCVSMPDFTISMKHTTVTNLTSTFVNVNFTQVLYLPTFLPVAGWNTHTFDTPFYWDGTSNILIDICTTFIPGTSTQNASVYYTPTANNSSAGYDNNFNPACYTTHSATVSVNRANMQITGEAIPNAPPGIPYNENPFNGSVNVDTDGELTWNFGYNTDTFDLWFGPGGNMLKVIDNQPAESTGAFIFTGLSIATNYVWQVNTSNSNGTTYGPLWHFSTPCEAINNLPWHEGFEGVIIPVLPCCWLLGSIYDNWITTENNNSIYDADAHSGTQFLRESENIDDEYIWTSGFNLSAGVSYDFSFWWAGDYQSGWSGEVFWNTAQNNAGAVALGEYFVSPGFNTTNSYEQVIRTVIPETSGIYYFGIRVYSSTLLVYFLSFDDFSLDLTPTCLAPEQLGTSYIAAYSADLIWVSLSGLSDIEYGLQGFIPTGIPTITGVSSPYNLSGLNPSTNYSFYVRDDCGGGDYSGWAGPYDFITQSTCLEPLNLGASNNTTTSVDLSWSSFSGLSDIEIGQAGFIPTEIPTHTGVVSPFTLNGLNSDVYYDFYVRDDCGDGEYSTWAGPFNFMTLAGPHSLPVLEDFENGFVLFNNAAGNSVNWTLSNILYHSGVKSAHNAYLNNQNNILHETGLLNLSNGEAIILDFWQIAKTDGNVDHCYVEISTDAGVSYSPLPVSTYLGLGTYDSALYNNSIGPCFDEDSYSVWGYSSETPDNSWWKREFFDLSDYLVPDVRIRFRLHSNLTNFKYGWLLDKIAIYEPDYGTLSGTVTDALNGEPVEGAIISVGSLSTTTAIDGTYSIPGVLTGLWDVYCTKPSYAPASASVNIMEDQTTTLDFLLEPTISLCNPNFTTGCGAGDGFTNFAVEQIQNYNSDCANLNGIGWSEYYNLGPAILHTGMSYNFFMSTGFNTQIVNIWIDFNDDEILTEEEMILDNYYLNTPGFIYSVNIYIPDNALGGTHAMRVMAVWNEWYFNPCGSYTYGEAEDYKVVIMPYGTLSGSVTEALTSAPISGATVSVGLLSDITGSDGTFSITGIAEGSFEALCIKTGYNSTSSTVNILEGQTTIQDFALTAPVINVNPLSLGVVLLVDELFDATITINNSGNGLLQWDANVTPPLTTWLNIEPAYGNLEAGASGIIEVHLNSINLLPQTYYGGISFSTDPAVGNPEISISMTVTDTPLEINLQVSYDCTDVNLSWEIPPGGNPDSWNIYRDGALIGNTTSIGFTNSMVMPGVEYAYYVKAVYNGIESVKSVTENITVPIPGNLQPNELTATANNPSYGYVTLEWNEPDACLGPVGFDVYRDNLKINSALVPQLLYLDGPLPSGLYEYKLKAIYYFGESGFSDTVEAMIPVIVYEASEEVFKIFPNPVKNELIIKSTMKMTGIKVFNNSGQLIKVETFSGNEFNFNVSGFEKGIYYLEITTSEDTISKRITVN